MSTTSKSAPCTRPQLVQVVVVPAARRRAADEPRRAVVGEDHPVALQRLRTTRAWRGKPEMSKLACSRTRRPIGGRSGSSELEAKWRAGIHVRAPRALGGEAQRVVDRAAAHLLVAREAGQDRQPGGVGRGPAARAQAVRAQVPDRARARAPAPAAGLRIGGEQLVQAAAVAVHDDHVAVAVELRPPSIGASARDRVAAAVGLVGVVEATRAPCAGGATRSCTGCRSAAPSQGPEPKSGCTEPAEADAAHEPVRVRARPAARRRAGSSGCRAGRPGSAARASRGCPDASAASASTQPSAASRASCRACAASGERRGAAAAHAAGSGRMAGCDDRPMRLRPALLLAAASRLPACGYDDGGRTQRRRRASRPPPR